MSSKIILITIFFLYSYVYAVQDAVTRNCPNSDAVTRDCPSSGAVKDNTCSSCIPCPNYYWRDFSGIVPVDAFIGAMDTCGSKYYVGQVFFREWDLLPATIYPKTGTAIATAYSHILESSDYVKILSTPSPSVLEWVPIKSEDLHLYLNRAIIGGSEINLTIYIGRVHHQNEWLIGKVFTHDRGNKGLWVHHKGQPNHLNFLNYEILLFNCNFANQTSVGTPDAA